MSAIALRLAPADRGALAQEFDTNLQHGRAFANAAEGVEVLADCVLILVHPDSENELELAAHAVMVGPDGIGVELRPFDETVRERIKRFIETPGELPHDDAETERDVPAQGQTEDADPCAEDQDQHGIEAEADADRQNGTRAEVEADAPSEQPDPDERQRQAPRHERLRRLNNTQQHKLARTGELNDRVLLERLYGKNVWEPLLQNPRLTVPEVARIARKGTVPRPLLEQIADNNTWIQAPIVRRALLGNPRVPNESIAKLLRITPKHELKTIVKTGSYPMQVRDAAKKLLG